MAACYHAAFWPVPTALCPLSHVPRPFLAGWQRRCSSRRSECSKTGPRWPHRCAGAPAPPRLPTPAGLSHLTPPSCSHGLAYSVACRVPGRCRTLPTAIVRRTWPATRALAPGPRQLGFMAFFGWSFPLMGTLFMLNNMIEMRPGLSPSADDKRRSTALHSTALQPYTRPAGPRYRPSDLPIPPRRAQDGSVEDDASQQAHRAAPR